MKTTPKVLPYFGATLLGCFILCMYYSNSTTTEYLLSIAFTIGS